jgi:hypothetical protein
MYTIAASSIKANSPQRQPNSACRLVAMACDDAAQYRTARCRRFSVTDADGAQGAENTKNRKKPKKDRDHDNYGQYAFDLAIHGKISVHEPEQYATTISTIATIIWGTFLRSYAFAVRMSHAGENAIFSMGIASLTVKGCSTIRREPFTEVQQAIATIPGIPSARFWANAPDAARQMSPTFTGLHSERTMRAHGQRCLWCRCTERLDEEGVSTPVFDRHGYEYWRSRCLVPEFDGVDLR